MSLSCEHNFLHNYLLRKQIKEMRKKSNEVLVEIRRKEIQKSTTKNTK
jgi:hypothetical protein